MHRIQPRSGSRAKSNNAPGRPGTGAAKPGRGRRWLIAGLVLLLCTGAGLGWYRWRYSRLSEIRALQKELFGTLGRQLSAEERRAKFAQLRAQFEVLTPTERQGLRAEGTQRRTEQMNRYFRLSPEERSRYLDELIEREEKRRAEREARAESGNTDAVSNRRPRESERINRFAPAAERDKHRQDFLDAMPASQRAEWSEFRKEVVARRQQLGLPVSPRP